MEKVAVLMSTYNGEKYIEEQIKTILCQKEVLIELFIRDDQSTDKTGAILEAYQRQHSNIHVSMGTNLGVGNSFMQLLYSLPDDFDYYALADQDDIWEGNKLYEAIKILNYNSCSLYASNQECVDKYGKHLRIRYSNIKRIHTTPVSILEKNMLSGCTMVFKKDLFRNLKKQEHRPSSDLLKNRIHDVWIAMVASIYSGIYYDKRSFIKYRQHETNVVGACETNFFYDLESKCNKLFGSGYKNGRSILAKEICDLFYDNEIVKNRLFFSCAHPHTIKNKMFLLRNIFILKQYSGETALGLALKIIFDLF